MLVANMKCTLDEYHRLIADGTLRGRRVELIKGELSEMPFISRAYAYFSTHADKYLTRLLGDRATVRHSKPITLWNDSEPVPSLSVIQPLHTEYLEHHPYSENVFWVIEFLEFSRENVYKDFSIKANLYAESNISEYWIVCLETHTLIVFRHPEGGRYTSRQEYTEGTLSPITFPGLSVRVSGIIRKIH